jgi:hypothetical protein
MSSSIMVRRARSRAGALRGGGAFAAAFRATAGRVAFRARAGTFRVTGRADAIFFRVGAAFFRMAARFRLAGDPLALDAFTGRRADARVPLAARAVFFAGRRRPLFLTARLRDPAVAAAPRTLARAVRFGAFRLAIGCPFLTLTVSGK